MSEFILEANEISKKTEDREILRDVTINAHPGEIVSVLGTKNSGKTTLMRILAGFEQQTSGAVLSKGKSITRTPAHKRNICSVFADSVLFPNMTVSDNIAYPLKLRGRSAEQTREAMRCAIEIAGLKGQEKKYPHELSIVQQKRAVIARAAVSSPEILLLDEPFIPFLSNERASAIRAVKELKKEFELTVVCATADNEVAMQLSDRVFILRAGRTEQSGPPSYLYSKPRSAFTANIMGRANIIKGRAVAVNQFITVDTGNALISAYNNNYNIKENTTVTMCVRPENMRISTRPVGNSVKGVIVDQIFSSATTTLRIKAGSVEIYHIMPGMSRFDEGDTVYAEFDPHKTILVDIINQND